MPRRPAQHQTDTLAADLEAALVDLWSGLIAPAGDDLSRTSASVLNMLRERPHRITELAAAQSVAQPSMTVAVQRLEARGLVTRERATDDRRATNVVLTDAGRAKLAERRAQRARFLDERLAALTPAQRAALVAALPALHALTPGDPA
ncbi:MAG TPA: MarR family transcriptional regulator [Baekduia sp.]